MNSKSSVMRKVYTTEQLYLTYPPPSLSLRSFRARYPLPLSLLSDDFLPRSKSTGINKSKETQSTKKRKLPSFSPEFVDDDNEGNKDVTVSFVFDSVNTFVKDRDWDQFHTPRNIAIALAGEAGELAEIFQWMGDDFNAGDWEGKIRDEVGQEIADVGIYAARLLTLVGGKME